MLRGYVELWLAFFSCLIIGAVYGLVLFTTRSVPAAGELFGHTLGIVGFILMLLTETLYSIRKRSRKASLGRLSTWLKTHIYMGIVGPFMVLLHTSWKFNGIAGATTLLTIIIVVSGFIGRYVYTRIPRALDGAEIDSALSPEALKRARRLLSLWHTVHIPIGIALFIAAFVHVGGALYYATFLK
ncbi:MAG: hypothetical protein LC099_00375 [Anaerolineales bacterium]|nr:hypothetical protein [Anaerolineales bacterium]